MNTMTVSHAKAHFSGIARNVIRGKKPVIVRAPSGFIQIAPYDMPREVPPARRGTLKLGRREIALHNRLGDTL